MKQRTINVHPYDTGICRHEGGFVWTFSEENKKINLHFERWWLSALSDDIRKVLQEETSELERLKNLCGFTKIP